MSNFLRKRAFHFITALLLVLSASDGFAQACNGADGSGIFTGSIANRDNGTRCANQRGQAGFTPGTMEIDLGNIDEGGTVQFQINWDDGSAPQAVVGTRIGPNRFFASVTHQFPDVGANVRCEYRPVVRLIFNGTVCNANLGTPPRFVRWNTDNQNTGRLRVSETATNVTEYLVCEGVETNVTFTDRTTLNCVPPDLTQGPNNFTRWRQFVYGTTNTITGTVRIGALPRTFPYNGAVDQSANPILNSGFPTATTQIITVPATARVGEVFELKMNYWNTCNSYASGRPPVETFARIRIVAQPAAPTAVPQVESVCRGTTPTNPTINAVPGSNTILWYSNNAGDVPGALITSGTNLFSIPIGSVPGYANNLTPGTYKVWVSYRPSVANALNCESPKVLITRTIRNQINIPDPTVGFPAAVCQGTSFSITMPAATAETYGGATEYQYIAPGSGLNITSSTATTATYSTTGVTFAAGELFTDRTITIRKRYSDVSPTCSRGRDFVVRIHRNPVGGTPDDFPDVCEGAVVGPINLNGYTGTVQAWQMRIGAAGNWNDIAGSAGQGSITVPGLSAGASGTTYYFRARIVNGNCPTILSGVESVTVSPPPGITVNAGPDQSHCNILTTNLNGSDPAPLIGTWSYVRSVPAGKPAPAIAAPNSGNSSITASAPGLYVMRWTVITGSCTFVDEVEINFGAIPTIPAMPAIGSCNGTATLNTPALTFGSGSWSVISGPNVGSISIADASSNNTSVTMAGANYGAYTFRWTVTSGTCTPEIEDVIVTFYQTPTVSATDVNGICLSPTSTTIALSGSVGGGTPSTPTGTWEVVTGAGTISNVVNAAGVVTANYNANSTDYTNGTNLVVRIKSSIGAVCPEPEQLVTINVDKTPVPDAGTNPTPSCDNFVALNAVAPVNATGLWSGAGVTFDDPTDPSTTVRSLPPPPGSVTLTWTLRSTGGNNCTASDNITVQTFSKPNVVDHNPIICEGEGFVLTDFESFITSDAGTTKQWFKNGPPPLGVPVNASDLFVVQDGDIFVAEVSNASCSSYAYVSITERKSPDNDDAIISLCEDVVGSDTHANVNLQTDLMYRDSVTTAANNVKWFSTLSDASNNVTANEITSAFDVVSSRTVYARITYPSGEACPVFAQLDLVVNEIPDIAGILGDQTVCMGASGAALETLPISTYQVDAIPGARYTWSIPQGAGEFLTFGGGGAGDFFVLLKFPYSAAPVNPLNISVRIDNNGCSSPLLTLPISRNAVPAAPAIIGPASICENSDAVEYRINTPNSSDYIWEIRKQSDGELGGALIESGQTDPTIFVDFLNENVNISVSERNGICDGPAATIPVTVNLLPQMDNALLATCSQQISNITLGVTATSVPAATFVVRSRVEDAGITSTGLPTIPPDLTGNQNIIRNDRFTNKTAVPLFVNYTVAPVSAANCAGPSKIVTLQVNPEPQIEVNLGKDLCSGEITNVVLKTATGKASADQYVIESITNTSGLSGNGIPALNIPIDENGIKNNSWTNSGAAGGTIRYNIKPINSATGCVGETTPPIEFMIHPKPVLSSNQNPMDICSGMNTNIDITSTLASTVRWTLDQVGPNIIGASAGTAASPADIDNTLSNSGVSPEEVRYNVIAEYVVNAGKSCFSDPLQQRVIVRPLPTVNTPGDLSACADNTSGLTSIRNLTLNNSTIDPSVTTTITWLNADGVTPIPNPTAFNVSNAVTIYAAVRSNQPGNCVNVVPVMYTIHPAVSLELGETDDVTCAGRNDGKIEIIAASGTGNFNFRIGSNPAINSPSPFVFENLGPSPAGGYTIHVTDRFGCSADRTGITITQPQPLNASANATNVSCFFDPDATPMNDRSANGTISVTASGGPTGAYIFTLIPGGTTSTNGVFNNVKGGNYTVRVADADPIYTSYCFNDVTGITVAVPAPIQVAPATIVPISCYGSNDGQITVLASGGTGRFTYTLDQVATSQQMPLNQPVVFNNQAPGTYTISVRDENLCKAPTVSAVIANMTQFNPGNVGSDQDICPEGTAQVFTEFVEPYGGTGSYDIVWQYSSTGTISNASDPLNDNQWFAVPGGTTNVIDPNTTLDKNIPAVYYRRLVGNVITRPNPPAACVAFKYDKIIKLRNLPQPAVELKGGQTVCEGKDAFVSLEMLPSQGTPPMTFDVFDGDVLRIGQTGAQRSASYKIMNAHLNPTIAFTNIRDSYGCLAEDQSLVIEFQPKPTIGLADLEKCSGEIFEFNHQVNSNYDYEWNFGDGSKIAYAGSDPPAMPIQKAFPAGSTTVDTKYNVRLTVYNSACGDHFDEKTVTIAPTIARNIIVPDDEVCSGETIVFQDNTEGVTSATWTLSYKDDNGVDVVENFTFPVGGNVPFTLPNPTSKNPLEYDILYSATRGECSTQESLGPIYVYKNPAASFVHTPENPQLLGGVVDVTYTIEDYNNQDFDYSWSDVGQEIISEEINANGDVRTVQYGEDKPIDITLFVVNSELTKCAATLHKFISLSPVNPSIGFNATPLADCFPVKVTTENISASYDRFEWTLYSSNGTNETSTLREPQFTLMTPGTYTLTLVGRKSGTTLPAAIAPPKTIHVLDRPIADFLLRMKQVYIKQAVEPINASFNATDYLWDFGDGEISEEYEPRHFYQLEGKDSITLIASKNHGDFDVDGDGILDGTIFCRDTTKQAIHVIAGGALKIPNAFTPNVNGPNSGHEDVNWTNDVFLPITEGVEEFTMQIFDRWGTLVFESRDKTIGWNGYDRNGRLMPAGVYVYKLVMRLGDNQRTTQVGDVTLIR